MQAKAHGRALIVMVLVAAAALLGACSSSSSKSAPTTTTAPHGGPGTVIAAGLKVQPGSRLVGVPFPAWATEPTGVITTNAVIAVDGDATATYQRYVTALDRLGDGVSRTTCSQVGRPATGYVTCETLDARTARGDTQNGRSGFWMSLVSPGTQNHDFDTTMMIQFFRHDPTVPVTTTTLDEYWSRVAKLPTTAPAPTTTVPAVQVLTAAGIRSADGAPIPTTGQPIASKPMDPGVGLEVPDGATLLVPAAPLNGGSLGWTTVARVTGNPLAARAALFRDAGERVGPDVRASSRRVDGKTVRFQGGSSAGGAGLYTVMVPAGDGTWFMLINVNND